MPDKNDFSELIAELLRGQDRMNNQMEELRKENKENADRTIASFDRFATTVVDHLNDMRNRAPKDFRYG
jgi:hypothetical protein